MEQSFFHNPIKMYLDLVQTWKKAGMPNTMLPIMEYAWDKLSDEEKKMAVKMMAWELQYGVLRNKSDKDP